MKKWIERTFGIEEDDWSWIPGASALGTLVLLMLIAIALEGVLGGIILFVVAVAVLFGVAMMIVLGITWITRQYRRTREEKDYGRKSVPKPSK